MPQPTQTQLDDFGRRLEALTVEFEELKRQADDWSPAAPEPEVAPATQPYEVPDWLEYLDELFRTGQTKEALREAGRLRDALFVSISAYSLPASTELLDYLDRIGDVVDDPAFPRLRYSVARNVEYLGGRRTAGLQTPPPQPVAALALSPRPAPRPRPTVPRFEASDLLGPRALAIAGGIVTVLGIVFFFVLAVHRGWIGPGGRVALGGAAATIVFLGGLELRRRYGPTHSALAAVGAGIAGGYATLLSAAALYDLLPDWGALVAAAAIASVGLVTALRWRSQLVAGLGLIGATLVPVALIAQGSLTALGTTFAGIVFAGTAVVAVLTGWRALLVAGGIASVVQVLALVGEDTYRSDGPPSILAVAAFFVLLYAATGIARQLRLEAPSLDPLAAAFMAGGALVGVDAAVRLFATSEQRGFAFLAISIAYAAAGAYFFVRRPSSRDLSAFLTFVAFTLGAVSLAELLNGQPLAYAWAAEAAGLAWLARRVRELRLQAWSLVYLALAGIHVLAIDVPPRQLLEVTAHPASGVGAAAAVAAAGSVVSFYARPWTEDVWSGRLFAGFFARMAAAAPRLRHGTAWLALAFCTYALSLGVVAAVPSFAWATVALAGIWATIGLADFGEGIRRGEAHLRIGGFVWLVLTGVLAVEQALRVLGPTPLSWTFAIVGASSLIVSIAYSLGAWHSRIEEPDAIALLTMLAALGLFTYPIVSYLSGREQGLAVLGVAVLYAAVSTLLFLRSSRDFSTLYWMVAVALAATADVELLSGTYSVLAWAAAGVALAWLARRVGEPRLFLGAGAFLMLAVGCALTVQAPPSHLFHAQPHPGNGSASLFIAAVAVALAARIASTELGRLGSYRTVPWWIAGVLTVYGLSLLILELFSRISHADLHTEFQRGHTAVSAFWGALGLALLYVGLKKSWRSARIAGLALFAVSLAKIFLYDLPSLSSITRALSFLAVGAVLLLGGFFYQRLTVDEDEPPAAV